MRHHTVLDHACLGVVPRLPERRIRVAVEVTTDSGLVLDCLRPDVGRASGYLIDVTVDKKTYTVRISRYTLQHWRLTARQIHAQTKIEATGCFKSKGAWARFLKEARQEMVEELVDAAG